MSPRCRNCSPVPQELRVTAGILERRWTMATIYACSSGAARFNEFRQSLPGVSPTTLSDRLEQLAAELRDGPGVPLGYVDARVVEDRGALLRLRRS